MDSLNSQMAVPAVCRIPGKGTAFLVATGVLMTTTAVVPNAREASRLTAVFFEGTKKPSVEVKLLPERLYFSAMFPEHVNYCLVACETNGIFNVVPVKIPLVKSEWPRVEEGDTLLVMQHLFNGASEVSPSASARFDEVLRRRDDIYFLKANQSFTCAGCPVFDANSRFAGIQSQFKSEGEGYTSRILSVVTIVKHLFANAMCNKLDQNPPIDDIWDTWYVKNDTTRIISIMANFKTRDVLGASVQRLCEHTAKPDLLEGVVACGGTRVLVASMHQFREDEMIVQHTLRSLWDISFGEVNNRSHIVEAGGVETVLEVMGMYPHNQDICEFGIVLLFNLTLEASIVDAAWASRCALSALTAMKNFPSVDVLQKFATGLLANVIKVVPTVSTVVISEETVSHLNTLMVSRRDNLLLMESLVPLVALLATERSAATLKCMRPCIPNIIYLMVMHHNSNAILLHGNSALWSLGSDVENRVEILRHPDGPRALSGSVHTLISLR